jgi:hypothetical protein
MAKRAGALRQELSKPSETDAAIEGNGSPASYQRRSRIEADPAEEGRAEAVKLAAQFRRALRLKRQKK